MVIVSAGELTHRLLVPALYKLAHRAVPHRGA